MRIVGAANRRQRVAVAPLLTIIGPPIGQPAGKAVRVTRRAFKSMASEAEEGARGCAARLARTHTRTLTHSLAQAGSHAPRAPQACARNTFARPPMRAGASGGHLSRAQAEELLEKVRGREREREEEHNC